MSGVASHERGKKIKESRLRFWARRIDSYKRSNIKDRLIGPFGSILAESNRDETNEKYLPARNTWVIVRTSLS